MVGTYLMTFSIYRDLYTLKKIFEVKKHNKLGILNKNINSLYILY